MKRILGFTVLLIFPVLALAQTHNTQQGTVIRMRMTDCPIPQHGFMAAMSGGGGRVEPGLLCPEYVLVADKVVYIVSGKTSEQLLPLAEVTRFRLQKNEMLIRIEDAQKESHFHINAMMIRAEWDRTELLEQAQADADARRQLEPAESRQGQR